MIYGDFEKAIAAMIAKLLYNGQKIHPNNWQSMDVSVRPEALMKEIWDISFSVPNISHDLDDYRKSIKPNLPWADDHFEQDRVSGAPVNPGFTWKDWPWSNKADTFRTQGEQFDHSYAERFWPKWAGKTKDDPKTQGIEYLDLEDTRNQGYRFPYGDLNDVVELIHRDPTTRQAVLPIFFPEDTGATQGQRVPCSLFYHFIVRDDRLHMRYDIRSCDALRHFRDDIYLAIRLQLWVIDQLKTLSSDWEYLRIGKFTMNIGSFHCFINDIKLLAKQVP